jgi:hypothetical protein
MSPLANFLMVGAVVLGCAGSAQAETAKNAPMQLAQTAGGGAGAGAAGTAPGATVRPGAGTAPAGAAGRPPVPSAAVRNPPAAAGTASAPAGGAAGTVPPTGATTPASPSAATPTPVPSAGATATVPSNRDSRTATNPNGVTVTDPTMDDRLNQGTGTATNRVNPDNRRTTPANPNDITITDPAGPGSSTQGGRVNPNGVTVTDPSNPDGVAGTLEGPAGTANRGTPRPRSNESATVNPDGATPTPNARRSRQAVEADFAADLRSCEGLPPGELAACRGEAHRRRGNM